MADRPHLPNGGGSRPLVPTPRQASAGRPATPSTGAPATSATGSSPPPLPDQGKPRPRFLAGVRTTLAEADPRRLAGPKMPMIVLTLTATVGGWDDAALLILLPEIRSDFAVNVAFLAALGQLMNLMQRAFAVPFGYLADRVSRVWMIRLGSVIRDAMSLVQGFAPGVGWMFGARMATGVAQAATLPASFPYLADTYGPEERARVFSFQSVGVVLGGIVGPILVGFLGVRLGWRATVVILGGLATAVSALTFLLREPRRGEAEGVAVADDVADDPPSFAESFRAVSSITTLRRFWYAAPMIAVGGVGIGLVLQIYYADVYFLDAGTRGLLFALGSGLAIVLLTLGAPYANRLVVERPGRLLALTAGIYAVQGLSFLLLSIAPNLAFAVAVGVPASAIGQALAPAQFTLLSMVIPPRLRGTGLQTGAPFELLGLLLVPIVIALATGGSGIKTGMLLFGLPMLPAAAIVASTASHIDKDIRNARRDAEAAAESQRRRTEGTDALLVIRNLEVGYDGVQVLFDIDLDVAEGELVALLGTNGAGKSTVLRAIAGTQDPTAGAIFLDGRDITHLPPQDTAAIGVVMMPGGQAVFADLTVADNLRAACHLHRDDDQAAGVDPDARIDEVLGRFPVLRERLDQRAGTLSGGEQQMVALGQAFLMRPRLLMIDELSLGLAPRVVEELLDVLREIHAAGTTIVVVEQSLNVALSLAERAVFMEKGEVRFDGPTTELLARPDLVRSVFIGAGDGGRRRRTTGIAPSGVDVAPALEVTDLAVAFGGVQALDGVDLAVQRGEILGVIGPNGAGKTTLFDVVSGFVAPDRGSVRLGGQDVTGLPAHTRSQLGLGRSFQNAQLFPALTVRENIAAFMERDAVTNPMAAVLGLPGWRRAEGRISQRVDDLIELLGLEAFADKFVGELSTGSRRIVDVAGVMAQRPDVLLLDEPTTGLAQAETEALGPLMVRIVRDLGCAIVVIEHDVPLVTSVADRMVAMELGRDLVTGTPDQVTGHPDVIRSYLAATETSLQRSGTPLDSIRRAVGAATDVPAGAGQPTSEVDRG